MNTIKRMGAPICVLMLGSGILLFAQGPLTPTGPPAPTMKSLDQIEPRTPISSIPLTITQPGSYFLTGNLTLPAGNNGVDGIIVAADNVTIDLGGFTLDGAGIGYNGISDDGSGHHFILIRNGNVQNWTQNGLNFGGGFVSITMENLQAQNNSNGFVVSGGGA